MARNKENAAAMEVQKLARSNVAMEAQKTYFVHIIYMYKLSYWVVVLCFLQI